MIIITSVMHDLCTLAVIKYLFVCRYLSWALDTNQEERDKVLYTEHNAESGMLKAEL